MSNFSKKFSFRARILGEGKQLGSVTQTIRNTVRATQQCGEYNCLIISTWLGHSNPACHRCFCQTPPSVGKINRIKHQNHQKFCQSTYTLESELPFFAKYIYTYSEFYLVIILLGDLSCVTLYNSTNHEAQRSMAPQQDHHHKYCEYILVLIQWCSQEFAGGWTCRNVQLMSCHSTHFAMRLRFFFCCFKVISCNYTHFAMGQRGKVAILQLISCYSTYFAKRLRENLACVDCDKCTR